MRIAGLSDYSSLLGLCLTELGVAEFWASSPLKARLRQCLAVQSGWMGRNHQIFDEI